MDLEAIFGDPSLRRWWLLNKALENAPLAEALKVAQAADEFLADQPETLRSELALTARASNSSALLLGMNVPVPASTSSAHVDQPVGFPRLLGVEEFGDLSQAIHGNQDIAAATQQSVPADVTDVPVSAPMLVMESDEEEVPAEDPGQGAGVDMAVWANLDDIVRYLRQRDDVVVSAEGGMFLVNGRFRLDPDELLLRANKMRRRQGKPEFQRVPMAFTSQQGSNLAKGTTA